MPKVKVIDPDETKDCECTDCCPSCQPIGPIPISSTEVDVKLQLLSNRIAKTYVPKDLANAEDIAVLENTSDLSNVKAYIYIDNNGNPVKILATTVLNKEISWDDLSDDLKKKFQTWVDEFTVKLNTETAERKAADEELSKRVQEVDTGITKLSATTEQIQKDLLNKADIVETKNEIYLSTEAAKQAAIETSKIYTDTTIEDIAIDGGEVV